MNHSPRRWTTGRWAVICFIAVLGTAGYGALERRTMTAGGASSGRQRLLLLSWDEWAVWQWPMKQAHERGEPEPQTIRQVFENIVDEHALAEVDMFALCIWARFETTTPNGFKSANFEGSAMQSKQWYEKFPGLRPFHEQGGDHIRIMSERAHHHGMKFLASLRMNDRHGIAREARFYGEHPEWRLRDFSGGLDYEHDGVRRAVLAFVKEALGAYELDGIEFDFMRFCHMFHPSGAEGNAPLLTDMMRRTRDILDDAAARRRVDRLILSVRVPQTLDECRTLGLDVAAWISKGLVDYVCPMDFFYTDMNIRTEDYVALTEGTPCKVLPGIHPLIQMGDDVVLHSPASYAAAARNFYAFGAHGISVYNYHYHWRTQYLAPHRMGTLLVGGRPGPASPWPQALGFLSSLPEAAAIATRDRHYLFTPLWSGGAPTGATKDERIVLKRNNAKPQGSMSFRMAERLRDSNLLAVFQFKVIGMLEGDRLEVRLNGQVVAPDLIERTFHADGRPEHLGRPLPPFHSYRMALHSPPARFGDNELTVSLVANGHGGLLNDSDKEAVLDIREIEVYVRALDSTRSDEVRAY